jgi:hypothetical protein
LRSSANIAIHNGLSIWITNCAYSNSPDTSGAFIRIRIKALKMLHDFNASFAWFHFSPNSLIKNTIAQATEANPTMDKQIMITVP